VHTPRYSRLMHVGHSVCCTVSCDWGRALRPCRLITPTNRPIAPCRLIPGHGKCFITHFGRLGALGATAAATLMEACVPAVARSCCCCRTSRAICAATASHARRPAACIAERASRVFQCCRSATAYGATQASNGLWCFTAVKNTHTTPLQPRAPYPDSHSLPNNSCESWIQLIHATLTHHYTQPHTHPTHPRHPPIC
jgi:hypothetical protein